MYILDACRDFKQTKKIFNKPVDNAVVLTFDLIIDEKTIQSRYFDRSKFRKHTTGSVYSRHHAARLHPSKHVAIFELGNRPYVRAGIIQSFVPFKIYDESH